MQQEKGVLFRGAYLPQKLDPKSNIVTRYKLFQGHVLSYQVNSFQSKVPLMAPEKGYFFKGVVLPQKLTPKSSIETER
jgi:hypothetical protein